MRRRALRLLVCSRPWARVRVRHARRHRELLLLIAAASRRHGRNRQRRRRARRAAAVRDGRPRVVICALSFGRAKPKACWGRCAKGRRCCWDSWCARRRRYRRRRPPLPLSSLPPLHLTYTRGGAIASIAHTAPEH